MAFRVGQKVVCIDDKETPGKTWGPWPRPFIGCVYTIDGFHACRDGAPGLILKEIDPGWPFAAMRFRPVVERETDISIFTAMLNPSREKVRA